jgi:hypothetical protein
MAWVPRSCAASPCVIERITVIRSAILAVSFRFSEKNTPGRLVLTVSIGPRYSTGASVFGSNDS